MNLTLTPTQLIPLLPASALDDYAEYLKHGGRYDLEVWWSRYKDDYVHREREVAEVDELLDDIECAIADRDEP